MSRLTFAVTGAGLAVPVSVGLNGQATAALAAAGKPIPPPVRARGLLDTASDVTDVQATSRRTRPAIQPGVLIPGPADAVRFSGGQGSGRAGLRSGFQTGESGALAPGETPRGQGL